MINMHQFLHFRYPVTVAIIALFFIHIHINLTDSFILSPRHSSKCKSSQLLLSSKKPNKEENLNAQGIVSSLTNVVNFFSNNNRLPNNSNIDDEADDAFINSDDYCARGKHPPLTPLDLKLRIEKEYVANNYLWTGNIDPSSFEMDCKFADPTLSFIGLHKFISNVQNLRPIVDLLTEEGGTRSDLLDIKLYEEEGYVETRWNMVGDLIGLWWKPRVDVIGRTKFWFRYVDGDDSKTGVRVYFYDEMWEIPAMTALIQLIKPT